MGAERVTEPVAGPHYGPQTPGPCCACRLGPLFGPRTASGVIQGVGRLGPVMGPQAASSVCFSLADGPPIGALNVRRRDDGHGLVVARFA